MTKARNIIAEAMASYLLGKLQYHKANVRLYLEHPAGIGETGVCSQRSKTIYSRAPW